MATSCIRVRIVSRTSWDRDGDVEATRGVACHEASACEEQKAAKKFRERRACATRHGRQHTDQRQIRCAWKNIIEVIDESDTGRIVSRMVIGDTRCSSFFGLTKPLE